MEENKAQVVEMQPIIGNKSKTEKKAKDEKPSKLNYEQLYEVANQLAKENTELKQALMQANLSNVFKRMDYLFKVVESSHMFNDKFVDSCIAELENTLTVKQEEDNDGEQD